MSEPSPFPHSSDPLAGVTLEVVFRAVRKHWFSALVAALAFVSLVAFVTLGQTKVYRSTATVHIDPNPPRPLGKDVQAVVDMGVGAYWSNKEYYATQYKIIASRAVAVETVMRLGLHRNARFVQNLPPDAPERSPKTDSPPPTADDVATELQARLRVTPVKDSRLVVVDFDDADPDRATRVLAALLDVYLQRNVDQVVASTGSASEWLGHQVGKLKSELESSELALHEYKKDKRILSVSLDDQSNMLRQEMHQLSEALTAVQARRQALLARHRELQRIEVDDPDNVPATELVTNVLLSSLRVNYVQFKSHYASLVAAGKGKNHPDVAGAAAQVQEARSTLLAEIRNVQGAIEGDLNAATHEMSGLSGLLESAKQHALDLNMLEIEYRRLERSKENTEKLYSLVLERSKESDLTGLMRFNNITVAEAPIATARPVRPRVPLNLTLGLLAGIAVGLIIAVGRELLDRHVRSPDDLEAVLGIPSFGLLPTMDRRGKADGNRRRERTSKVAPELAAHSASSGAIAEAARRIRTNLLFASPDKPYRRILVTSASPGEGKTMVASTLAIVLAQTGKRVLLVDCDLRRARLHRVFNVANDLGVTASVVDHSLLETAVRVTETPNLTLLPSGPHVATPAEVLQSDAFAALLETLCERYETIVLDSPPVAVVTDAAVLAKRVDATVFVARAGKTSRDVARRAVRNLRDVGARLAGCVLNDVSLHKRGYGYAQYYGYYHKVGYESVSARD